MKMYQRDKILNVSSESAWQALKEMNKWLSDLSTNSEISYLMDTIFFEIGRKYNITSKEGVVMDCELYSIDEENMTVEIHAEHKPLKSILICKVLDLGDNRTQITRIQGYPGWFGKIFTVFFGRRESGGTAEYLEVWGNYAESLEE